MPKSGLYLREDVLMHCEWCGQEMTRRMGAASVYGRVLCSRCLSNPVIWGAMKKDYERRRARGW